MLQMATNESMRFRIGDGTLSYVLINAYDASMEDEFRQRSEGELRRPIYIDGVSVGICRGRDERTKTIHVHGITKVVWYFIARGHRIRVMMPHFVIENGATFVDNMNELHSLMLAGFIDFIYGHNEQHERRLVYDRLASEAYRNGGCIVTTNSLVFLRKQQPILSDVIDNRLLTLSFDRDGMLKFPIDTNGKYGPVFNEVIACNATFGNECELAQIELELQRQYLHYLVNVIESDDIIDNWRQHAKRIGKPNTPLDLISSIDFHNDERRMLRRYRVHESIRDDRGVNKCDDTICTFWNIQIESNATIDSRRHRLQSFPSSSSSSNESNTGHQLYASLCNIFDDDTAMIAVGRWPNITNLNDMIDRVLEAELTLLM